MSTRMPKVELPPSRPKPGKLGIVAKELRRISKENSGILNPKTVVDEARPRKSPLHDRFEWDDTVAAEEYRIWQARQLIRVCVEILPGTNVPTEVFVSLRIDRGENGGYRNISVVLSEPDLRRELLADALAELRVFQAKYRHLKELSAVFEAIDKVDK